MSEKPDKDLDRELEALNNELKAILGGSIVKEAKKPVKGYDKVLEEINEELISLGIKPMEPEMELEFEPFVRPEPELGLEVKPKPKPKKVKKAKKPIKEVVKTKKPKKPKKDEDEDIDLGQSLINKFNRHAMKKTPNITIPTTIKNVLNPGNVEIWKLSDRDLRDLFIKFVGFIGILDKEGYAILDPKGEVHEGDAYPEPVDEITGEYFGITDYQADSILTYRDADNLLNIWSRGFGKTWKSGWIVQIVMKYEADKFLYFSLTEVAYIVADWVYLWAEKNNAIIKDQTSKVYGRQSGRKASYQKFGLVNGARFEIHGIRTSSTLGFHGWIIIFDDIIDEQQKRLVHLQKALEMKWNSQYSKIRRKKLIIDNTRKFPGDFFDFMINQFELKGKRYRTRLNKVNKKYLLTVDHKTPYKGLAYKGDIVGYRAFVKRFEKKEIKYKTSEIIAPWYSEEDFEAMKLEDIVSFNAEILGIPMEIEGGMIGPGDIQYSNRPMFGANIHIGGTGVDSANTEDENNDFCSIVSVVMHGIDKERDVYEKKFTCYKSNVERILARNFTPLSSNSPHDWVNEEGKKIKRGLIETVQVHCEFFKMQYPGKRYIIAMERNNAGIAYMEQALHMYRNKDKIEIQKDIWVIIDWPKYLCEDPSQAVRNKKFGSKNLRLGITHIQEKITRIYSELKYPIEKGEVLFTPNQEESLLVSQLLSYPNGKHDDGPDGLGMIKDELDKRWFGKKVLRIPREVIQNERRVAKASEDHKKAGKPWLVGKPTGKRSSHKRRVR